MNKRIIGPIWALLLTSCLLQAQEGAHPLTDAEKILGLSKVWKEADKNFVFFDQVPTLNWDSAYLAFIPKVINTSSDYQYFRTLQQFCSLLKDGHTRVYVPWRLRKTEEVLPAFRTELIGEKVMIVELLNDTLLQQGLEVDMEVLAVDGQEVHAYAKEKVQPFVFYSTIQDRNVQVYEYNLLKGKIDVPLKLTVRKGSETKTIQISRRLNRKTIEKGAFEFSLLENNIGHLKIYRFWGDDFERQFDSIYPLVRSVNRLIIDVSQNQGGNSGFADHVLQHFVDKPYYTSNWKTPKYMPAYASWGKPLEWEDNKGYKVKPVRKSKRYMGKLVVLITEKTYSAGEDFVSAFLNTNRGKVVGRPTAGTTGNPIGFELPGGGGVQICSKRDYLYNGQEFVGYGIKPQVPVEKSMNEALLLAQAVALLKE